MDNQTIQQFIRQAGRKAKQLRASSFQIVEKGHDDYVTSVDRELDAMLASQFQQWFPQDGIITEENPASLQIWQQDFARFWSIDPIDGTSDFIAGREHYAIMVGLLQDRQPVMGWVHAPESDRLYFGGSAIGGLFMTTGDDAPIPMPVQPPQAGNFKAIVSEKDERKYGDAIFKAIPKAEFYSLGSFGLKVMEVILGNAGLYLYFNRRVKLWDTVGPLAIARTAGLVCCDLQGDPIEFDRKAIDPSTLTHNQVMLIGWPDYIDRFRSQLARALADKI